MRSGDEPSDVFHGTALIVEVNILIAMAAEDLLRSLGFGDCHIVASVGAARARIAEGDISFAMLDINLGDETSEELAMELRALAVPFIFATGFGECGDDAETFAGVPMVVKPYSETDLRDALEKLAPNRSLTPQ